MKTKFDCWCDFNIDDPKETTEPPRIKWCRRGQEPSLAPRLPLGWPGEQTTQGALHSTVRGQLRSKEYQWGVERPGRWSLQDQLYITAAQLDPRAFLRVLLRSWGGQLYRTRSSLTLWSQRRYHANDPPARAKIADVGASQDGHIQLKCHYQRYLQHDSAAQRLATARVAKSAPPLEHLVELRPA